MWREQLKQERFKTLYFNAWENDHSDDALVSLIGELSVGIGELKLKGRKGRTAKAYLEKAKKFGAGLIKKGVPLGIRLATGGVIDISGTDLSETGSKLSELAEEVAKEQIDKYEESKNTIQGFRGELSKFADEVTAPDEGQERRPIVIMVDELDRCRPPYAVQLLEKIKHLFNVRNIVFVIAIDKEQLGNSIKSMYGQGMDVNGYLRRFIDFDFNLPTPEASAFCHAQFTRFGLKELFEKRTGDLARNDQKNLTEAFTAFFRGFGLTLREQEHCFTLLSLALRTTKENNQIFPFLLSILIVMKIKNHQLYLDFVAGRVSHEEVLKYIRTTESGKKFLQDNYGLALEIQLAVCQSQNRSVDELIPIYGATATNNDIEQPERDRAARIVELMKGYWHGLHSAQGSLAYLVQKIDLVSRFET